VGIALVEEGVVETIELPSSKIVRREVWSKLTKEEREFKN